MTLIAPEISKPFESSVRRKSNKTGKIPAGANHASARDKAARTASGSPQVMVKITGFGKGADHVAAHMKYIGRNGDVEIENDRGELFKGRENLKDLVKDWTKDINNSKRRAAQRDTMHSIFSMPAGTSPDAVRKAVRRFASDTFGHNHEFLFALHTDAPHPHVHLTVKMKGFDGKRLNPRKADLQKWREDFALNLRAQGIDAEASPRVVRGVVQKKDKQVLKHIEQGDKTHAPRVPRVKAKTVKEIADELVKEQSGQATTSKPWDAAIQKAQKQVRAAWLAAATSLEIGQSSRILQTKELHNVRPNYEHRSTDQQRFSHHVARSVYQSHLDDLGRQAQARSIASLRNLPNIDVVYNRINAEMLLQQNASERVGRSESSTHHEVRWQGAGDSGDVRSNAKGNDITNGELAKNIRQFVASMPPVKTKREELKAQLTEQFKVKTVNPTKITEKAKEQDRDLER